MNGDNKNLIVTILAIIGGLVVLSWFIRTLFWLLGPLALVAVAVLIYIAFFKDKGR